MVWRARTLLATLITCLATIPTALTISSSGQTVFCTYDFEPYTSCTETGVYGVSSSIVNTIEATQGNEIINDYIIVCLSSRSEVLEKLKTCECDIGVGAFGTTAHNLVRTTNMTISYPYAGSAYGMIVYHGQRQSTVWGLFKPFTAGLWILVAFTPLALAVLMTFFSWAISKYKKTSFSLSLLPQYAFQNTLSFLNEYTHVEYMDWNGHRPYMLILKFLLQSMLVAYAFLCLIVTSVYTAQLTNVILTRDFLQPETTFRDLIRNLGTIRTPPELVPVFQSIFNREPVVWVPDTTLNVTDELERVRRRETDGLIVPVETGLWALHTQNADCQLDMNPRGYKLTGQVMVFGQCVDQRSIDIRNRVILEIGQKGVLGAQSEVVLGDYHVSRPPPRCTMQETKITIHDVAGGWIILAIAACLPFIATVSRYVYYLAVKCITLYGNIFVVATPPGSDPAMSNRESEELHLDMKSAEAMYAAWSRGDETKKHDKGRVVRLSTDHNVRLSTESCSRCSKYTDPSSHGPRSRVSTEYPGTPTISVASGWTDGDNPEPSLNIAPVLDGMCPSPFSNVDNVSDSTPSLETIRTDNTSSPGLVFREDP
jgi:hypothetical protein